MKRHHPKYYGKLLCDQCNFVSVNLDALRKHTQDHTLGLIREEGILQRLSVSAADSNRWAHFAFRFEWRTTRECLKAIRSEHGHSNWEANPKRGNIIGLFSAGGEYRFIGAWSANRYGWRHHSRSSLRRSSISELKRIKQFLNRIRLD